MQKKSQAPGVKICAANQRDTIFTENLSTVQAPYIATSFRQWQSNIIEKNFFSHLYDNREASLSSAVMMSRSAIGYFESHPFMSMSTGWSKHQLFLLG